MDKLIETIVGAIEDKKGKNIVSLDLSGFDGAIAMDYVDVVVHIFQTELRGFYRLEELWADAPMTKYEYEE